jgi:mannitol-1-phosphate 5-dehydrogenase
VSASEKSIAIFGAGKIGRSFIGQLFSLAGYQVIFIDVDQRIINELNRRNRYCVVIKSENEEVIEIFNVHGINSNSKDAVIETIANCSILATCVGKNALPIILPVLAKGVEKRFAIQPGFPLDIILAENVRDACVLMSEGLKSLLGAGFPVDTYIGFIETSIGKMVPIMPKEVEQKDPLLAFAEPYNTLILDKNGFKNPIPDVPGLAPKENIKAWVDRKAFIHNLGHATAAYYGHFLYPDALYLYEVLEDRKVLQFTKSVMHQSAEILKATYPEDFSASDLEDHIEDLISRFRNKALRDTIFRIGQDLPRKLGPDDRFVGLVRLAISHRMNYDKILKAMTYAFFFKTCNEDDKRSCQDLLFDNYLSNGIESVLLNVCGFDHRKDKKLIRKFISYYALIDKKHNYSI